MKSLYIHTYIYIYIYILWQGGKIKLQGEFRLSSRSVDFIDTLEWWRCSCLQRFSQSCPGVGESVRCSWRCWSVTHYYLEWNREKVSLLSHGEVSPPSSVSTLLMSRRVNQPQVWPISPWLLVSRCSLLVSSGRSSEPPPQALSWAWPNNMV